MNQGTIPELDTFPLEYDGYFPQLWLKFKGTIKQFLSRIPK